MHKDEGAYACDLFLFYGLTSSVASVDLTLCDTWKSKQRILPPIACIVSSL